MISDYICAQDLYACRLVCKSWNQDISRYLEREPWNHCHRFVMPPKQELNLVTGKFVEVCIKNMVSESSIVIQFQSFFTLYGENIEFLKVVNDSRQMSEITVISFYLLCQILLGCCPNLTLLHLENFKVKADYHNDTCNIQKLQERIPFPNSTALEELVIRKLEEGGPLISQLFLEKFGSQLKRIELQSRGSTMLKHENNFDANIYTKCEHLAIAAFDFNRFCYFNTLGHQQMPNLKSASICLLSVRFAPSISEMIELTLKFPVLECLCLKFCNGFDGLCSKELIYQNPTIASVVSELHIIVKDKYQNSFDFLIHFPNLKALKLHMGNGRHIGTILMVKYLPNLPTKGNQRNRDAQKKILFSWLDISGKVLPIQQI